jgi:hypothetical protein
MTAVFMRQPRLFISSSLADQSFTKKLADYLYRAYDEVWFDSNRYGGEVWWEDVLWNIKASDIFIYLLSPSSIGAGYCGAEYAEAQRLRKQILPVVIRPNTPIPPDLAELQPVDLSEGLTATKVGELLAALKQLENQFPKAPPIPVNVVPTPVPAVTNESPRRVPRWILAVFAVLVGLALIAMVLFAPSDPPVVATTTAADTSPAPTSTPLSPTPTVERLATTVHPTRATQTRMPTDMPTSTPTVTMTELSSPVTATNRSTVPPTVTRRYSATPTSS